ncbi:MAG: hypothetical protein ACKOW0_00820 [Schleiferiaceae bacterium]
MPIVLTPTVNTTQSIAFDAMVDDLSAFLPGCPGPTISRTAKKVVTDLCQRGKVWHEDLAPVNVIAGQVAYALASPVAYAECTDVTSGYLVVGDKKIELLWAQYPAVRRRYPQWPENEAGQPRYITSSTIGVTDLAPVPDTGGVLYPRGYLRPTSAATVWDADLYREFQREVFHGVLHELMMMPKRSWSDDKAAVFHGRQWTHLLSAAKIRAARGYNVGEVAVIMRPFA